MRHRKRFNHLSRKSAHRKALFANMAASLILNKRIRTTTAKAKALRMFIEPLITKSKKDSTHSRRVVFSYIRNKYAVTELFREISPKITERPGGYTRILKTGNRLGDNADMCIIELVDYNENMLAAKTETKAKTTRRRRVGKKKSTEPVTETLTADVSVDEIPEVSDETRDEEKTDTVATSEEPGTGIVEDEIKESAEEVKEEIEETDPTPEPPKKSDKK